MKSAAFRYARPGTLDEAIVLLGAYEGEAKVLAGGQSLLPAMNMRLSAPEILVDLSALGELRDISMIDGRLRIGAMTRYIDLEGSPEVALHAPLITQAIPHVAHAAIRNRGTLGGSLCNADPASELPACAVALDARFNICGGTGWRTVGHDEFFQGTYTTCLGDDDVLASVDIPVTALRTLTYFSELSRRRGDYAMVGIAARACLEGGAVTDSRLVFFGVGEAPVRALAAEAALDGSSPDKIDAATVCGAVAIDIEPFDDLTTSGAVKLAMAEVLAGRALDAFTKQALAS